MYSSRDQKPQSFLRAYLALICIAAANSCSSTLGRHPADWKHATEALVLYNAQVFTAEPDHFYADAVAIRDGRIIAVGTRRSVERMAGKAAREVDLHGKFLMPGLIDAHVHPFLGGLAEIQARYTGPGDIADIVRFVTDQLGRPETMRGDVLVVNGFSPEWPNIPELNIAFNEGEFVDQRILLYGYDGHTAWANRATLMLAGITQDFILSLPPAERHFYGTDAEFNPNGFLQDLGVVTVERKLPPISSDVLLEAGRLAVRHLNDFGITAWMDVAVSGSRGGALPAELDDDGFLESYRHLAERGELTAHVAAYPVVKPDAGLSQVDVVEAFRARFKGVPNLDVIGLKIYADGIAEFPAQSAALTKPYTDRHSAPLLFKQAKMNAMVTEAARRGLYVHVHAVGDLAIKATLDAFEVARKAVPQSTSRFSIGHVRFVDRPDVPRFAQLDVVPVMQLLWASPEASASIEPYIDPEIYKQQYVARSLLDAGATVTGGSDWLVSSPNPFLAMQVAETRTTRGSGDAVLDPRQRMPRLAMLYAYTRNAAQLMNQLNEIGSIAPGKLADLVLVDRDVLTIPATELEHVKVIWTMFEGRIVSSGPGLRRQEPLP